LNDDVSWKNPTLGWYTRCSLKMCFQNSLWYEIALWEEYILWLVVLHEYAELDLHVVIGGRYGHDCMVAGFTTTYTICAYHHYKVTSSNPTHGRVYSIQHCDKVCQWLAASPWFFQGTLVSSSNKSDKQDNRNIVESGIKTTTLAHNLIGWFFVLHYFIDWLICLLIDWLEFNVKPLIWLNWEKKLENHHCVKLDVERTSYFNSAEHHWVKVDVKGAN
jgi:hypothetical protein